MDDTALETLTAALRSTTQLARLSHDEAKTALKAILAKLAASAK
jgi:hypothetical protein